MKYLEKKDVDWLADYIAFYLSETIDELSDWDCEHLAINMINELKIVDPAWRYKKDKDKLN